jgi:3-dehydroquinate synthase
VSAEFIVPVELGERRYEIAIGEGVLDSLPKRLPRWLATRNLSAPSLVWILTDSHTTAFGDRATELLSSCGLRTAKMSVPAGETSKSFDCFRECLDNLIANQADRATVVVAVGGGVIGDLGGFVAAAYARGLPFVQIPTTLLADVDSSVGGKTGINHPLAKNMIGAFHQPLGVLIDTALLGTLPDREYRSGLAEVVKYGVIADAEFFTELERSPEQLLAREPERMAAVIARSCELKARVVEQDEHERTGLRAILNYGHTFAHVFEALSGYGELLHGEAVSIGMDCAARLAESVGRVDRQFVERQATLLGKLGLPVTWPQGVDVPTSTLIDRMRLDKKSVGGKLRFILPTRMGHVETVRDVPEAAVDKVLLDLQDRSRA